MSAPAGTLRAGIDVGSTTVKLAVLDADDRLIFHTYERHRADIRGTLVAVMEAAADALLSESPGGFRCGAAVTGSGGLSVARWLDLPFVQEVIAGARAVQRFLPDTDVAIELGGEDAKITYFSGGLEQRMNGTCAGGTGAFIDQMAASFPRTPRGSTSWRAATRPSTPSRRAAACLPRPTCSRSSTRGRGGRTSRRASSRPS